MSVQVCPRTMRIIVTFSVHHEPGYAIYVQKLPIRSCSRSHYPTPRQTTPHFPMWGSITCSVGLACAIFLEPNGRHDNSSSLHVQCSMQGINVDRVVLAACVASFREASMHGLCKFIECGRSCSWGCVDVYCFGS